MSTFKEDVEWAINMINAGYYSICDHAKQRMNERNISTEILEDIVKNGVCTLTKKGRLCFEKDDFRIIIKVMKFRVAVVTVIRKGESEEC